MNLDMRRKRAELPFEKKTPDGKWDVKLTRNLN
jgi:hypothetical protein